LSCKDRQFSINYFYHCSVRRDTVVLLACRHILSNPLVPMAGSGRHQRLSMTLLLRLVVLVVSVGRPPPFTAAQRATLVAWRDAVVAAGADPDGSLTSWTDGSNECGGTWAGIVCDIAGSVTVLALDFAGLTTSLPPAFSSLSKLRTLQLGNNALTGPLPDAWSALTSLTQLDVRSNLLSGTLPAAWGQGLPSLATANIRGNTLTGSIPPAWSSLTSLTRLILDLNTDMCGLVPSALSGRVSSTGTGIPGTVCPGPSQGLLALKAAVSADPSSVLATWVDPANVCSSWQGVQCAGGQPIAVDLSYYQMQVGFQGACWPLPHCRCAARYVANVVDSTL
jgi:hypothetical protein